MAVRRLRIALFVVVAAVWCALGRLTLAFWNSELDWVTVASYSRRDAPWYYRVAGVWGGLDGSLLLFTALIGAACVIVVRQLRSIAAHAYAVAVVVGFAVLDLTLANPFRRLDVPAVGGFGLTPILEHPAMAVHPPLLYAGLAATLGVFLLALDGRSGSTGRWLRCSLAAVTLAMALGAIWSYVEQGWGGYWAWDPVENTSLLVWLGVLVALHRGRAFGRGSLVVDALPWLITLMGACIVRSGSTPSIHGFGQRAAMGWWLLAFTVTSAGFVFVVARRAEQPGVEPANADDGSTSAVPLERAGSAIWSVRITALIGAIVLVGTLAPVFVDMVGDRPAAVRGSFYAAFVGPAALVGAVFLAARLRHVRARGWTAHLGMLVLLVGIGASTFDRTETVIVRTGQTVNAAGVPLTNVGLRIEPGPRIESDAVVATVVLDGHTVSPRRVAFRDRGGQLAENAVITRPWRDLQVQLDSANDAGVMTLTVYNRPLMWLVWLGVLLVAAGALRPTLPRRRRSAPTLRDVPPLEE